MVDKNSQRDQGFREGCGYAGKQMRKHGQVWVENGVFRTCRKMKGNPREDTHSPTREMGRHRELSWSRTSKKAEEATAVEVGGAGKKYRQTFAQDSWNNLLDLSKWLQWKLGVQSPLVKWEQGGGMEKGRGGKSKSQGWKVGGEGKREEKKRARGERVSRFVLYIDRIIIGNGCDTPTLLHNPF